MKGFKFIRQMGNLRNRAEASAGSGAAGEQGKDAITSGEPRVFQPEMKSAVSVHGYWLLPVWFC